jgi:predicted molibdopterin-dependent oxidoreductase YjgC
MLRRLLDDEGQRVRVSIDGKPVTARAGDSVAAAMLSCGLLYCRSTPLSGQKRAPYCMMGVCFECQVTIDGIANRQGCLTEVSEGMRIETQLGPPVVE